MPAWPSELAGLGTGLYVGTATPDEILDVFDDQPRPQLMEAAADEAGVLAAPCQPLTRPRGRWSPSMRAAQPPAYALEFARRDVSRAG